MDIIPPSQDAKPGLQEDSQAYIQLYNNYLWIRNKCREIQTAIDYEKAKYKSVEQANKDHMEEIHNLLREVQDKVYDIMVSNMTFSRLQPADILYKATFSNMGLLDSENEELDEAVTEELQEYIHRLLVEDSNISSKISEVNNEVRGLQSTVQQMQLELLEMTSERSRLLKEISAKNKAGEEKRAEDSRARIEMLKSMAAKSETNEKITRISNFILQLLISHSGVNWAKDPDLLELIIDCQRPIDEQLEDISED